MERGTEDNEEHDESISHTCVKIRPPKLIVLYNQYNIIGINAIGRQTQSTQLQVGRGT